MESVVRGRQGESHYFRSFSGSSLLVVVSTWLTTSCLSVQFLCILPWRRWKLSSRRPTAAASAIWPTRSKPGGVTARSSSARPVHRPIDFSGGVWAARRSCNVWVAKNRSSFFRNCTRRKRTWRSPESNGALWERLFWQVCALDRWQKILQLWMPNFCLLPFECNRAGLRRLCWIAPKSTTNSTSAIRIRCRSNPWRGNKRTKHVRREFSVRRERQLLSARLRDAPPLLQSQSLL